MIGYYRNKIGNIFTALILSYALVACGGGSGGPDNSSNPGNQTKSGRFIDSAVIGLTYESVGQSGSTDGQGAFLYEVGDIIDFYIGDILIGQAEGKQILTPVEFVEGAIDETDSTVTNICRFLLTLDDDNDPSNGIYIPDTIKTAASGMSVNFNQSINDFSNDSNIQSEIANLTALTSFGQRELVSSQIAQSHFRGTLLGQIAGTYSGTFTGDSSGTWTFVVDTNGNLTGSGYEPGWGKIEGWGTVQSSGSTNTVVGSDTDGCDFTGHFSLDGNVSGTWYCPYWGESGTWAGRK